MKEATPFSRYEPRVSIVLTPIKQYIGVLSYNLARKGTPDTENDTWS